MRSNIREAAASHIEFFCGREKPGTFWAFCIKKLSRPVWETEVVEDMPVCRKNLMPAMRSRYKTTVPIPILYQSSDNLFCGSLLSDRGGQSFAEAKIPRHSEQQSRRKEGREEQLRGDLFQGSVTREPPLGVGVSSMSGA